jgi:hypothetical protein
LSIFCDFCVIFRVYSFALMSVVITPQHVSTFLSWFCPQIIFSKKRISDCKFLKSNRNVVFFYTVNVSAVYNTGTTSPRISSTRAGDTPTATSKGITPGAWSGFTPRRAAQETSTGCCQTTFITSGEHCALAPAQRHLA